MALNNKNIPYYVQLKDSLILFSDALYVLCSHEIVNIDLREKPEWYQEVNSLGKVPLLEEPDGRRIAESHILVEYLDDKYSEISRLLPNDPKSRALHKMLVERIMNKVSAYFTTVKPK